ncbi:DUF2971 domain-containing protein [Thalassobius sp. I31.1]|uniref:DUF2971 domain-containing protein n=1 Tax=Thalassobius sp. I31.1 TaxID=2109912 RepID=UPI000D198980|nr:DUF2971 domain-containing protein [Thalassobius sp. I31.1]
MRLYKFIGNDYALENLLLQHVKISKVVATNDPFEMVPFRFSNAQDRDLFFKVRETHTRNRGFISFSESSDSPSMWANYANNHKDLCLGFEAPEAMNFLKKPSTSLRKISYVPEFREFNTAALKQSGVELLEGEIDYAMGTKSLYWEYENEWRLFVGIDQRQETTPNWFLPYSVQLSLREVIVGRDYPGSIEALKKAVSDENVNFFRAAQSIDSFSITKSPKPRMGSA